MNRRHLLVLCVLFFSCTRAPVSVTDSLPAQAGEWKRGRATAVAAEMAPNLVRDLGLEAAAHVTYSGPSEVGVRVFRMRAATSAFELIQKWRQGDGLAAYKDRFFLVADAGTNPEHAKDLLRNLQQALK